MATLYVAGPGRQIPGGWPEDGRAIQETSAFHRLMVMQGDLVPLTPAIKPKAKSVKKEEDDG